MGKKPLILETGTRFDRQGDAIAHFRGMLNGPKQRFTQNDKVFSKLLALYKRHPEFIYKSKNVDNIDYFLIKDNGEYKTLCFYAVHKDGSQTDWSYKTAITENSQTQFQNFVDGARHALELEKDHFRDAKFTETCRSFLQSCKISEDFITKDMVSESGNAQYRSSLLEPIRSEFLMWYKSQNK